MINNDEQPERKLTRNQKRKHDEINHVQTSYAGLLSRIQKSIIYFRAKLLGPLVVFSDLVES